MLIIATMPNGLKAPVIVDTNLYNEVLNNTGDHMVRTFSSATEARDALAASQYSSIYSIYRYQVPWVVTAKIPHDALTFWLSIFTIGGPSGEITPDVIINDVYCPGTVVDINDYHTTNWANIDTRYWFPFVSTFAESKHAEAGLLVIPDDAYNVREGKFNFPNGIDVSGTYSVFAQINIRVFYSNSTYKWGYGVNFIRHAVPTAYLNSDNINSETTTVAQDPFTPNPIPGAPGGISSSEQGGDGTGGGWGDFDYSSDGPQDKNPPSISTYDAGFCTLYAATQAQIKALADYMWADTGDFLNNWNKLWANPMDAILGISLVPLSGLLTGVSTAVKVGNIATSVYMTKLSSSIVRVDCGSIHITSQSLSHSFMDFPPYNQVQLYLPYIGTVEISATDVVDKYLSVSYLCDCLSGACVAFVMSNGYTIATYSGNIAAAVPVTSGDFANIVFAALDYLKVVGGAAATAGTLAAGAAVPAAGFINAAKGVGSGVDVAKELFSIGHSMLVPQITKGGPAGSTAGYMNHQKPFLVFNAPNVAAPKNMNTYIGYAQYETKSLGACHGFTKVADIHYRGAGTEAERTEIENLLRMGVDL